MLIKVPTFNCLEVKKGFTPSCIFIYLLYKCSQCCLTSQCPCWSFKCFILDTLLVTRFDFLQVAVGNKQLMWCIWDFLSNLVSFIAVDLMKPGTAVILRNAKIDVFKGSMRLAVDKWGRIEATELADFTVKEDNNLSLIEYELVNVAEEWQLYLRNQNPIWKRKWSPVLHHLLVLEVPSRWIKLLPL